MKTNAISTASLWNAPRTGVSRMQSDIANANKELVTGRHADVTLTLGSRTGAALGLRQTTAELTALRDGNDTTSLRLSTTQTILQQIQAGADATLKTITGAPSAQRAEIVRDAARSQLPALTAALNITAGGQSIFGGINTLETPVTTYGGATKTGVDAAFTAAFGARGNAGLSAVTPATMEAFLAPGGPIASLFDATAWQTNWSNASDKAIDSRISLTETVETSASANASPIRALAMAYVMASDLDLSSFPADVQEVASNRIAGLLGAASKGLVDMQADLGRSQAKITDANTRLEAQRTLLATQIGGMESVDPAEAKTRIDQLTTQVQISYSLTSELRQLSLVAYL